MFANTQFQGEYRPLRVVGPVQHQEQGQRPGRGMKAIEPGHEPDAARHRQRRRELREGDQHGTGQGRQGRHQIAAHHRPGLGQGTVGQGEQDHRAGAHRGDQPVGSDRHGVHQQPAHAHAQQGAQGRAPALRRRQGDGVGQQEAAGEVLEFAIMASRQATRPHFTTTSSGSSPCSTRMRRTRSCQRRANSARSPGSAAPPATRAMSGGISGAGGTVSGR
jgi:hypothetical protein